MIADLLQGLVSIEDVKLIGVLAVDSLFNQRHTGALVYCDSEAISALPSCDEQGKVGLTEEEANGPSASRPVNQNRSSSGSGLCGALRVTRSGLYRPMPSFFPSSQVLTKRTITNLHPYFFFLFFTSLISEISFQSP